LKTGASNYRRFAALQGKSAGVVSSARRFWRERLFCSRDVFSQLSGAVKSKSFCIGLRKCGVDKKCEFGEWPRSSGKDRSLRQWIKRFLRVRGCEGRNAKDFARASGFEWKAYARSRSSCEHTHTSQIHNILDFDSLDQNLLLVDVSLRWWKCRGGASSMRQAKCAQAT
jgi:hypothetical protein